MINDEVTSIPGWRGGDGNAAYLDKTLRYHPVELWLDDRVSWRVVARLWLRGFIVSVVVWLVFAFPSFLIGLGSVSSSSRSPFATGSSSSSTIGISFTLYLIGSLLSFVAFWTVVLISKLPEPIAEWRVLLADKAHTADSTYSQIAGTLRDRQLPIGGNVRRIRTGFGAGQISNRLVLTDHDHIAYVSVFGYGTSLYLGWMMWRSRRGAVLLGQFLVSVANSLFGRNDPERAMLRTERARAMREAVHAACREGLAVAIEGREVPEQYGFPYGAPPVENSEFTSAPVPGTYQPPPDTGTQSVDPPPAQ